MVYNNRRRKSFPRHFSGVIGIGAPVELSETTGALHAFNIPLIAVGHKYRGKKYDNILSTSPDVQGQAKVGYLYLNSVLYDFLYQRDI